jgi:hypothetical protein
MKKNEEKGPMKVEMKGNRPSRNFCFANIKKGSRAYESLNPALSPGFSWKDVSGFEFAENGASVEDNAVLVFRNLSVKSHLIISVSFLETENIWLVLLKCIRIVSECRVSP